MKLSILFLLLFGMISGTSCRKVAVPNLTLPEESQTGKNTLGFLIGTNVWANYGRRCTTMGGCSDNKVSATLYKQSNGDFVFQVAAGYTADTIDQAFSFTTTNTTNTGTFALDSNLNNFVTFFRNRSALSSQMYRNRQPGKCFITITKFDTITKIVSGVFQATLYNTFRLSDSVKIESGRFDAQLSYE